MTEQEKDDQRRKETLRDFLRDQPETRVSQHEGRFTVSFPRGLTEEQAATVRVAGRATARLGTFDVRPGATQFELNREGVDCLAELTSEDAVWSDKKPPPSGQASIELVREVLDVLVRETESWAGVGELIAYLAHAMASGEAVQLCTSEVAEHRRFEKLMVRCFRPGHPVFDYIEPL